MIQMEELYEKILTEMDLSKEVEDDELVEIIHRILDEKGKINYKDFKPVLFEMPTYQYLRTGDVIGDCMKIAKP